MDERRGPPRDAAKERFWRRVIEGFDPARSTVREWCAKHDVSEPSFYAWRRGSTARDAVRLVPIEVASSSEPATVVIELPGGLRLSVSVERLNEVLDVLAARRC